MALDAWIARWINDGHVVNAPGGCFVLHTAYGRIGDLDGGAIEMIGHDEASGGKVG